MKKILINLASIELNPEYVGNSGARRYEPGTISYTFTCYGELPSQFNEKNVSFTYLFSDPNQSEGIIFDMSSIDITALQEEIKTKNIKITITGERELIDVSTIDIPKYNFVYEPTFVKCEECNATFSHEYLESDVADCGDNYSSQVCPVCGEWDCCEIEYEDIQEALLRKEKL